MDTAAIKKMKLMQKISRLPGKKLYEVDNYLENMLQKIESKQEKPVKLKGIWKNKGFEKINNLESDLKNIREELGESILKNK